MDVSKLEPYQQRVVAESLELEGRWRRLDSFVSSRAFNDVSTEQAVLLVAQLKVMEEYLSILNQRISLF